ncbi:MAG: SDR family NAD(P)-dependent oxidoreductase [Acidobacteria bacterium]|nr:MAG: SDR family NAD(P)-dependent oxidoreductase [Acidobacteriota bacterium]REK08495.1 MAG: SDR family NAD(P)-dependent oxidoreductase [Acidobacteriota bacterium]
MTTDTRRTALITGANRGIGLAIARGLARRGLRVLAAARSEERASEAAGEIGGDTVGVVLDLEDPEAAAERFAEIDAEHGPVDVLVNNAGVLHQGDALEIGVDAVTQSLTVNTVAPLALSQVAVRGMNRRGWGRIVNVSSGWGSFGEGLEGPAAYAISKAALNAVTVTLAHAARSGVKVNACCPGWVRTRMGGASADRAPEEGAETPIWLATLPDDGPSGGFFRDREPIEW